MARSTQPGDAAREPAAPPPASMSYEAAMEEAQRLTDQLDRGEIGLEQSLAAFQRATELLKRCRTILEVAELQVKRLTETGELEGWAEVSGSGSNAAEGPREP